MKKLRKLGRSEIHISPIGLGCWQFSRGRGLVGKFWGNLDDSEIESIISVSLKNGVNWFDTAESYGWGSSEKSVTDALIKLGYAPGSVRIATKWWPVFKPAKSIQRSIGDRLKYLQGFPIDLYQIHNPFSLSRLKSQAKYMSGLIEQNKITTIGVSNFSGRQMIRFNDALRNYGQFMVSNQVKYSLLDRRIETNGVLETAKELDITIIAYSPLEQGLLTGKFHRDAGMIRSRVGPRKYKQAFRKKGLARSRPVIQLLESLSKKYTATPAEIALSWLITFHGDTVVAIPGASGTDQAESNSKAMRISLEREDMVNLDNISSEFKENRI